MKEGTREELAVREHVEVQHKVADRYANVATKDDEGRMREIREAASLKEIYHDSEKGTLGARVTEQKDTS